MKLFKMHSKHLLLLVPILLLLGIVNLVQAAEPARKAVANNEKAISLGFFPIISTVALFKRFSPLRDYLAEELGRPVVLKTAKNFPTFLKRTDNRSYDLVITAPHFSLKASDSGKYVIRATHIKDVQQLFVVRKNSPIQSVQELAEKKIATPPKPALMTMMGKRYLKDAGLTGNKQPVYRAFTSHNAANQAVLAGEMDAAIASSNIIKKAIKRGDELRILKGGNKLPSMALLVASDLDAELGERITRILVGMKSTEKGRKVLKQISFPGYRAVSAKDYEPARPYMEQAIANMKK
jgi:phosphonate transport system substrate-binding protein